MSDDELGGRRSERELARHAARGRRTDDGSLATLLVVHENDGSWTVHGLGAPGITLDRDTAARLLAEIHGGCE